MATEAEPTTLSSPPGSQRGPAALAVVLSILLVDAAVETFVSGSPVRWWVAGVVAASLITAVYLWRRQPARWQRFGWSARASASFFLLLGLLTFTAWLPGGLSDGIRFLGQPTSRVLSLLTAVVIALAGVSLVRRSWLPRWAKVVIGLLTAYGLAAFLKGIISNTEFAALLHGESMWSRLPTWLQGAFLGAFIIIPAGFLHHIVQTLKAAPGVSRAWDVRQVIAIAMSVLMVISGATNSAYGGPQPSAAEIVQPVAKSYQELGEALAGPRPKTPLTPDQIADKLEKIFPMLERAEREIPRDTFDIQAVVDRVGKDPQKLFAWVRDNTYFVPYRGLLRGDKGVLIDRLGNSLDRSMLLYAMLRNTGQPVRLAHGTLTEAQAEDLLKKVRPLASFEIRTGSASSPAATDAFIKQYADENHLDAARIRQAMDKLTAQQHVKELVQKRVAAQATMIAAAVGRPPKSALAEERTNRVRAVTDHWWVQWQNGANWIDFDPTLPDAQSGKTLTAAQATPAPNIYTDLGDDLLHTLQIQVVIEVWKHGHVTEVPVLTQKLLPADLIGVPIILRQIPMAWPQHLNLFEEKNPLERFKQTVLAQTEWMPVLSVGSQNVSRYSFNDYGDLGDVTLPGYIQNVMAGKVLAHKEEEAVEGLGKTIAGMLGGLHGTQSPGNEQSSAKPERAQVTAEWIDYEIRMPGAAPQAIRREMFDVIGPASRSTLQLTSFRMNEAQYMERAMTLSGETEILPMCSHLSPQFFEHLLARNLVDSRGDLLGILHNANSADPETTATQANKLKAIPLRLYSLAFAIRGLKPGWDDVYLDRLNIFSSHSRLRTNAKGEITQEEGFDIVLNDVAVKQSSAADSFLARVGQGVLDTNAESLLAAATCGKAGRSALCRNELNTAELLAVSSDQRLAWLSVRSGPHSGLRKAELPQGVRTRIEQDLTAGYAVLVPTKVLLTEGRSAVGWWRIDPKTGTTLGIGDRGWGSDATEYALTHVFLRGAMVLATAGCAIGMARGKVTSKVARAFCTVAVVCGSIALLPLLLFFTVFTIFLAPFLIAYIIFGSSLMEYCAAFEGIATFGEAVSPE